jgi:ABC-2 type transport system permease protein
MNTQANTVTEARVESQAITSAIIPASRLLFWSVRRELWENRWIYLAPLGVAGFFVLGFLISLIHLPGRMPAAMVLDPMQQYDVIARPYDIAGGLMMITAMIVAAFYCLDALYGERRDRSILFWKSLPVSDVTTVLAKASIPLVILPLLAFAIAVAMELIVLLVSSAVLLARGASVGMLWTHLSLPQMLLLLLYHIVTVHTLGPAPLYAWLMLVSAWARRAPFLWAVLPPLAVGGLEKLVFNTTYFANVIANRLTGAGTEAVTPPDAFPTHPMTHLTPGIFLSSSGLWIGLAVTAVFLYGAIRLRRYQGPI